jgi:hypothetical protein
LDQQDGSLDAKVRRAYQEAIGRAPSPEDQAVLTEYAQQFGLTNFCRVLFNLNEFSFVD